jgi:hypothetical protein
VTGAILGSPQVLQHVRNVIRDTVTPSWLDSVPTNFGAAGAGTIKAGEWQIIATIYAPLALCSIWGEHTSSCSKNAQEKMRQILDHTMDLLLAIRIACMSTMTRSHTNAYDLLMRKYVGRLQQLHPTATHRPNHHMALHLPHFLRLFGPTRSWWTFPFERLVGILQRLPTNDKFGTQSLASCVHLTDLCIGQLEFTMIRSFVRAVHLKSWLARPDAPPSIKECKDLFDKAFKPSSEDPSLTDPGDVRLYQAFATDYSSVEEFHHVQAQIAPSKLPCDLALLLNGRNAAVRARITYRNVVFTRSSTHLGNSLIEFTLNGDRTLYPIPGCIKYIFIENGRPTFAVHRHLPAEDDAPNPYAPYAAFSIRIYSSKLDLCLERVELEWVTGHFARWSMTENLVAIMSLCDVGVISFFQSYSYD